MRFTSVVLPAPVGPDDRDRLPGLDPERQVGDQRMLGRVRERHVLEHDRAVAVDRSRRIGRVGLLLVCVEQLEDPLGRRGARLHDRGHAAQLGERLRELLRVLDERLHVTETQLAARDHEAAEHRDADVGEVSDEHHAGHDHAREELRLEAGLVELLVLGLELLARVLLRDRRPSRARGPRTTPRRGRSVGRPCATGCRTPSATSGR